MPRWGYAKSTGKFEVHGDMVTIPKRQHVYAGSLGMALTAS